MEKRSYMCCWDGCTRTRMGDTSLCPQHHNQATAERKGEGIVSLQERGLCIMPGCKKHVSDLRHLHLCTAHLAIIVQQATRRPAVQTTLQEPEPPARTAVVPDPDLHPVIYYVRISDYIKIGWTSNLHKRMRQYPPSAVLLAVHPGSRADEARLHKRFAAHRTHGREWYAPVPSVLHHIDAMKREHGEPETVTFGAQPVTIPEPRPVQYVTMRSRSGASYRRTSA